MIESNWISTEDETKWPPIGIKVLAVYYNGHCINTCLAKLQKKQGKIKWYALGGLGFVNRNFIITHFMYLPMVPPLDKFTKYELKNEGIL